MFALHGFAGKPGTTFFRQFHCRKHCFRRTQLYCSNCGEFVGAERISGLICGRKLGGCVSVSIFPGSAARRAHGSSAEHAMRDLIASHAPLRGGRHTARQNGPKHYPRGFKGIAIPLTRLSPLSFAVQRKMEPPEVVGLAERQVKKQAQRICPRRPFAPHRGPKIRKISRPLQISYLISIPYSLLSNSPPHIERSLHIS